MIPLKKRDFDKIILKLEKKYEKKDRHTGHWQIRFFYEGKLIIRTKCSEGRDEIPSIIENEIRKQLHFKDDKELVRFRKCPLTCEVYHSLILERGVI